MTDDEFDGCDYPTDAELDADYSEWLERQGDE